jgi:hypothetical protein
MYLAVGYMITEDKVITFLLREHLKNLACPILTSSKSNRLCRGCEVFSGYSSFKLLQEGICFSGARLITRAV